jgi:diacylglycerol kinase family enzyme
MIGAASVGAHEPNGLTSRHERPIGSSPLARFLLVNPRSGRGGPEPDELAAAARERGVEARVLQDGDDPVELAGTVNADAIGVAGGDGSLAPVAAVALERGLRFVCVPFGTRNHFARDLGLDRNDPLGALEAFDGEERSIDVGRVGDRLFLNNVSFGVYASLVHRRERHRRRRDVLARLRALARTLRHPHRSRVTLGGELLRARVVLVANNAYELALFDLGARSSLTGGALHVYSADGLLPRTWDERSGESFALEAPRGRLAVAIDGEPAELLAPVEFRIEPRALRVLVPPGGER